MRPVLAQKAIDLEWGGALTTRQLQVVALVCRGFSNKAIAQELRLSEGTVKLHVHNIFVRIGVRSRRELIVTAVSESSTPSAAPVASGSR